MALEAVKSWSFFVLLNVNGTYNYGWLRAMGITNSLRGNYDRKYTRIRRSANSYRNGY